MKKAFTRIVCFWILFGICGCSANPPSEAGKAPVDETEAVQTSEHETMYADESETMLCLHCLYQSLSGGSH